MRLIAFVILALCLHGIGHARTLPLTPNSACGVEATGYTEDGRVWSGVAPRMQVGPLPEAMWHQCQPWVKDGEVAKRADTPQPKPCKGVDRAAWVIDGKTCGAVLPPAGHGYSSLATQEIGAMRGQATFVCQDGAFQLDAARSRCEDAPACDLREVIRFGSAEACSITIDSRASKPPVGAVINMPADAAPGWAGSARLRCEFGGWKIQESRCVKR